jgi:addiction module RelE/StbE family toxin
MKIIWSAAAKASLKEIADFIAFDNRKQALIFAAKIYDKSKLLADFPEMGREGRVGGTRELVVHGNYVMVYRLKKENIQILSIIHSARIWPHEFH